MDPLAKALWCGDAVIEECPHTVIINTERWLGNVSETVDMWLIETTRRIHKRTGGMERRIGNIRRRNLGTAWLRPCHVIQPEWGRTTMYTDGSMVVTGSFRIRASTGGTTICGAAVLRQEETGYSGIRIVDTHRRLHSAYDAELLALILATRMAEDSDVHSDCKSAINTVTNYLATGKGKGLGLRAAKSGHRILKVAAHADRTKRHADWTEHERGNIAADAIAGGAEHPSTEVIDISSDVVVHLTETTHNIVTYQDEQIDPDWAEVRQAERMIDYLVTRDATRAGGGRPPRWEGAATRLCGSIIPKCGLSRRARLLRMVWDKYATGYNREKWGKGKGGEQVCPTCGVADSQRHILAECTHDKVRRRRALAFKEIDDAITAHANTQAGRVLRALRTQISDHPQGYTALTGMISADVLKGLPTDELTQREYSVIRSTLKKVLLQTEQMYLEWGRQGQPVKAQRKRKVKQQSLDRWMRTSEATGVHASEPKDEDTDISDAEEDTRLGERRRTQALHDKRQWDR